MATNPTLITTPFAQSGDKTTPPNTNTPSDGRFSQTLGFPPVTAIPLGSGGKAPKREDFNGALNMLASILFYTQKGFTFNWDSGQAYYVGCRVIDSNDGNMYVCISDVTAGQTRPMNNASKWKKVSMTGGGGNIGDIVAFAGSGTPDGFLLCDGSALSRSTYSDLFTAIGTLYGAGDGSTTFNLPDLTDKFLQGSTTPAITKTAGLPNIEGSIGHGFVLTQKDSCPVSGALFVSATKHTLLGSAASTTQTTMYSGTIFDASRSNPIYGNSSTVQPPAVTVRYMIKYE